MTITDIDPAPAETIPTTRVAREKTSATPTHDEIAKQIRRELHCSKPFSDDLIRFFERMRDKARKSGGIVHVHQDDLNRYHASMDTIMPDDAIATPGTAHDFINRGLLDPAQGELGFLHTRGMAGEVFFCGVTVSVIPIDAS